jgi:hypothetical protein
MLVVVVGEEETDLLNAPPQVPARAAVEGVRSHDHRRHDSSFRRSANDRAKFSMFAPARMSVFGTHPSSGDHEN